MINKLRSRFSSSPHTATIDVAAAPPLAPVAPIAFDNESQILGTLDIGARIGEILIVAGTTNSDTAHQVKAILEAFGLYNVHVDLTYNRLRLFTHVSGNAHQPVGLVRVITPGEQNFHHLRLVDELIRDIHTGRATPANATQRLDEITTAPLTMSRHAINLSWGGLGGTVALLIGGDIFVAAISFITSFIILSFSSRMGHSGLPIFFQNVLGGIFASLIAAVAYHTGSYVGLALKPSMVIATCIIAMLAGLTLVQAIQNGVTDAPITAAARFFDTAIITGGVVAGVGIGIALSGELGIPLPPMETVASPNLSSSMVRVLGSIGASMTFARACYSDWAGVFLSGCTAFFASGMYYFILTPLGFTGVFASGVIAAMIGLIGGLLARRYQIPPLILTIAGVTPLLPGLSIYRGMYGLLHEQILAGFSALILALATATALSSGVVLGEWIARRIRRPRGLSKYYRFTKKLWRQDRRRQFQKNIS
ncbi:Threonine export carrier [Corynebacterium kutscheri]|uniref:Threonine export carrier n=1 Tax=Corynebacterium kutscheri TaxID=35755 RepID=A0A0F6QYT7_9CORY|nr:threonine/serine exporter family protein [Corynebacterium kutscheri]AKE40772.1 hypothetical protein UL82_02740 [Corynebacterium kutscheri]VEH04530.1 Threonine export carrier [Corynebacterium kutscheri]VEH11170.1 Threonine export carrier [Corynebacterium kutscheri]VEH80353.1 Threonine export carrier [Corynebacterium kutscheri]